MYPAGSTNANEKEPGMLTEQESRNETG